MGRGLSECEPCKQNLICISNENPTALDPDELIFCEYVKENREENFPCFMIQVQLSSVRKTVDALSQVDMIV